jgi:pyruvate dehydrogenase E2 component (dihydrolipoamide acetyltransferase)
MPIGRFVVAVEVSEELITQLERWGVRRGRYVLEPMGRVQRVIASRMTEAVRDIPTFPLTIDILIDRLLALRAEFNEAQAARISLNDLMIRAAALALNEVPGVNSSYTPFGLIRHQHADVAVAVASSSGLITPIILAAEEKSALQISVEARDLYERARTRRLKADEYTGGTFTISNLGMFGITSFASIINPPHSAILSVGAATPGVLIESGEMRIATSMTVTLTCDHRVIDGVIGANWLNAFRRIIEQQPKQAFD